MKDDEIEFVIDGFTPRTIPMFRLAEYMRNFAELLGNEEHVHFTRLKKGSTRLAAFPDPEAAPKIKVRLDEIVEGKAPQPAVKAHGRLDDLLASDNAIGHIEYAGARVIDFPGRRRPKPEKIGPIRRSTSVEGQIFQIGGKGQTINVHLRGKDGDDVRVEVSITLARQLAPYLLSGEVRLFGEGDWYRINAQWERHNFTALGFSYLSTASLSDSIQHIRNIFADVDPNDFSATMAELRSE